MRHYDQNIHTAHKLKGNKSVYPAEFNMNHRLLINLKN